MGAVRTVTQLNQVRKKIKKKQMLIRNMCIHEENIFITLDLYDIHYTTFFSYQLIDDFISNVIYPSSIHRKHHMFLF
jgi:hypothetical protein